MQRGSFGASLRFGGSDHMKKPPELGPLERRAISLACLVDERTLKAVLAGKKNVRAASVERVRRELLARDLGHLLRPRDADR